MNFRNHGYTDDWLFVIALLLPVVFAGTRYFEARHEMVQIAQARSHGAPTAEDSRARTDIHLAYAQSHGR